MIPVSSRFCRNLLLIFLLPVFLSACALLNYGPSQLPSDRGSYNESLLYSENQQILLNLVRLRYTDTPYFLTMNDVVSSSSISSNIGASVYNDPGSPVLTVGVSGNGSVDLSESPALTYAPYQGEMYVTRLLTPIKLGLIYTLLRAGWGANVVLRLTVQRLGPDENAALASRSVTSRIPRYQEFHKFGLILLRLQHDNHLAISADKLNDKFAIKLTVRQFQHLSPRERAALANYHLTPATPSLWFVSSPTHQAHQIYVQTRTVLGVLNYLSKGVEIPVEDIVRKRAPMTYQKNGQIFDWRLVTKGQMSIHSAKYKPAHCFLCIRYRNHWFYIADDDFNSKETLNILSMIMNVNQGEVKSTLPLFTVSRPR